MANLTKEQIGSIQAIDQGDDFDATSITTLTTINAYNKLVPGLGDKYKKSILSARQEKTDAQKKQDKEEEGKKKQALISVLFPNGAYEEVGKDTLKKILTDSTALLNDVISGVQCYSYSGFDPKKMIVQLAACQQHMYAFVRDMATLISIFFLRGTNVSKMMTKTEATAEEKAEFERIINLYNVKSRASKNDDVTLARLTIIFPALSYKIRHLSKNFNIVVKGTDLGLIGNDYQEYTYNYALYSISSSFNDSSDILKMLMYICYQSALAKKITKSKLFTSKMLSDAAKYAIIGIQQRFDDLGSMRGNDVKVVNDSDLKTALCYIINNGATGVTFDEDFGMYSKAFNALSTAMAMKKPNERTLVTVADFTSKFNELSS